MRITIYEGSERHLWRLPCCRNVDCLLISDSQARDIGIEDLPRDSRAVIFRGGTFSDALDRN